ncbi:MAG TPA: DUF1552 domain-containing protein [Polyangiaceae bacterium]|nr:DUF1552 domain-containing protein [Polyangiaceae bacterium]
MNKRAFLRGLGVASASAGLGWWLHLSERAAEGAEAPKRLILMQRPNGTIRNQWLPNGGGSGAVLGPILQPFTNVFQNMVALDGVNIVTSNGGNASHEGGMVTFMTGHPIGETRPPSSDDWKNTAPSLDQVFANTSAILGDAPHKSLQVAAHQRQDGAPEVANIALSYSGPDVPLYPEVKPSLLYQRLFGAIMPGDDLAELERARAKNKSVLDFVRADLTKLRSLAPASERPKLDAHEAAIRDLEKALDELPATCMPEGAPTDPPDTNWFTDVAAAGQLQLAILRTALACDLTRVVTFMWSAAASRVDFEELYPGMGLVSHHSLSHYDLTSSTYADPIAAIDTWYSEHTAPFIQELAATTDVIGGGTLLDNTLVVYFSEVSVGDIHSFDNLPILLFGGSGVGLTGGRFFDAGGRSTNDLWLSIAPVFGLNLTELGDPEQYQGPIAGLFG